MRRLILVVGVLAAASSQPMSAQEQFLTADETETIAFAISGGISLGSYKAGVNWFLIEANKRLHDPRYRPLVEALLDSGQPRPRKVELGAIGGASAGNINAVASALQWCRALPDPDEAAGAPADMAEQSLLWALWIPTGLAQLMPTAPSRVDPRDAALLEREFFHRVHFARLRDAMRDPRLIAGCNVPIAVTTTSISHDTLRVGPISAPVQRHAVIAEVVVEQPGRAHFQIASKRLPSMGMLIYPLPTQGNVITPEAMIEVIKASSAFPIAFAPVELRYYRYSDLPPDASCPPDPESRQPCADARTGMFSDGGAFDNLPLGTTLALAREYRKANGEYRRDHLVERFRMIPIDPYSSNTSQRSGSGGDRPGEPRAGLHAVQRLLGNAVSSARAYELQVFTRSLAEERSVFARGAAESGHSFALIPEACPRDAPFCDRAPDASPGDSVTISVTTRTFPLMGERMSSFGAFIGEPLRQYDFYLGVFDGIRQFAWASVCARVLEVKRSSCASGVVRRLLADPRLWESLQMGLSEIGWTTLGQAGLAAGVLAHDEWSSPPITDFSGNERVVHALGTIRERNLKHPVQPLCNKRHPVDATLCDRDYIGMLAALRSLIREDVESFSANRARYGGGVDSVLLEAVADPEAFVNGLYESLLWRQDRVERWIGTQQDRDGEGAIPRTSSFEALVSLAEAYYLSTNERYQSGYVFFPSSIPAADRKPLTSLARITPYYLGGGIGASAAVLGYRPTRYLRQPSTSYSNPGVRWGVIVPSLDVTNVKLRRGEQTDDDAWHWSAGAGVLIMLPQTALSAVEIVPSLSSRFTGAQPPMRERLGGEVAARLVANKIRLGIRRQPHYLWKQSGVGRGVLGVIAVNDGPGVLYWTYRLLRAH